MSTPRFTTSRRAPSYDLDDPVERKVAELQVLTGAHLSLRRLRFRGGWEARVNDRRWQMGSRPQLMMEVLEHLSTLAGAKDQASDSASDNAAASVSASASVSDAASHGVGEDVEVDTDRRPTGQPEHAVEDVVVDLTDRRTADRSNLDQSSPVAGLAGPVEETGP